MALAKTPPKSTEVQKTDEALEAEAKAQAEAEAKKPAKKTIKAGQMVTCELVKGTWLRQPSTKVAISRGDLTELKADGWLKLQIAAGLIKVVE